MRFITQLERLLNTRYVMLAGAAATGGMTTVRWRGTDIASGSTYGNAVVDPVQDMSMNPINSQKRLTVKPAELQ
jgi:hypothetical protein